MDTALTIQLLMSPCKEDTDIAASLIKDEDDMVEFLWIEACLFYMFTDFSIDLRKRVGVIAARERADFIDLIVYDYRYKSKYLWMSRSELPTIQEELKKNGYESK